ncbi:MAG: branched-chain amino acid transporter AzlD [Spirochaetes bacterium GWC1_27_15]|nr:MAG: branched-chain amino acid transporter AzlD [Spirochaetes bacterium GWB1_27_13]OHD20079.1 MAG: branched-chain amino acid transporter AzlD [Spirochaetes bacterium GWC1_27_15]
MMNLTNVFISIIIMSVITFFTRAFPFIFFRKIKPPKILLFIEKYIPPMVMVILVLYCLKDVKWTNLPYGIPELISIALVCILHTWKKNPLLSIFGGTIFYMIIIQTDLFSKILKFFG